MEDVSVDGFYKSMMEALSLSNDVIQQKGKECRNNTNVLRIGPCGLQIHNRFMKRCSHCAFIDKKTAIGYTFFYKNAHFLS